MHLERSQKLGRKTGGILNQMKNQDHTDYRMVNIGQYTEESPRYLKKLAIIQTPVNNHQLTLMGKTRQADWRNGSTKSRQD